MNALSSVMWSMLNPSYLSRQQRAGVESDHLDSARVVKTGGHRGFSH